MPAERRFPRRPQTRRGLLWTIAAAVVVVALAGVAVVYFVLFPTSSPSRFKLATTSEGATGASASTSTTPAASASSKLAGTWTIGPGSQAGYRVREKLAILPAESQAVGRTSSITGSATFTGANDSLKITEASFKVDVSTLKSDRSMRDEKIRSIGLESDTYPTATFVLAKPVPLPAASAGGKAVKVSATGAMTIHGETKTVTIPLEMRLTPAEVEAVGSITFPWGEYGMTAPSVGGFVSVTDSATMEFELKLKRLA